MNGESKTDLTKRIFIELLRDYHNGIGQTHAAQPQEEVAQHLAKDACLMADEFQRVIKALEGE